MCRLVAYLGADMLLDEVLVKPVNSIIMQSLHAKESDVRTNGDGFGVGWYVPGIDRKPALFRSIFPAWSDSNLLALTTKIKSPCFFAHVRAASVGGTSIINCHPFVQNEWMLMHNGSIHDFLVIKRHMRRLLDDDIYNWIQGETDSEHLFALFLQLAKTVDLSKIANVAEVLLRTLALIDTLIQEFGKEGASYFNLCLTNGEFLVATRYCTEKGTPPESLHYLAQHKSVMIASERLTDTKKQWKAVPANHILLVDRDKSIQIEKIKNAP